MVEIVELVPGCGMFLVEVLIVGTTALGNTVEVNSLIIPLPGRAQYGRQIMGHG